MFNFYGDIVFDIIVQVVGFVGLGGFVNIGEFIFMFEVIYGFVFDIVGKGIVNFLGFIYVVCMMLSYMGKNDIVV